MRKFLFYVSVLITVLFAILLLLMPFVLAVLVQQRNVVILTLIFALPAIAITATAETDDENSERRRKKICKTVSCATVAIIVLSFVAPVVIEAERRFQDYRAVTGFLDEYFGDDHDFFISNSQIRRGPTDFMEWNEVWRVFDVRSRSGVIGVARIEAMAWNGEILGVSLRRPNEHLSIPLEEWRDGGREWIRRHDDAMAIARFFNEHSERMYRFYLETEEIVAGPCERFAEGEIFRRFVRRSPYGKRIEFLVWDGELHSVNVICPNTERLIPFEEFTADAEGENICDS